ncbi:NADH-quinone oxidoreductase subunit D [Marinigracilibium pacificum]|uniref:NADH-quinone oxidoreductase subunit D n=1 Tax=Marinigracilibium pacificum TaxID=2729599 RepID=A0A848J1P3_9BACT|nr:NADH-quinone oxidoreductase subunit D [Marinigracilibium pacificum]NMM49621.1 NADH-quinone oxidoreductase subunit D [Marinigracilibium pacificum]
MTEKTLQYKFDPENLRKSSPGKYKEEDLRREEMIINIGPHHPSTHGVLRLEVLTDGEIVKDVVPHLGFLHRCFEKHAEALAYNQIIPYVDRLDYVAAMNNEHAYVMGVEKMLGLEGQLPKRIEYIRVLTAELNRLASHFVAMGTYGMDIGAMTAFFWLMRDREIILRMFEWLSGARLLYNYQWIGGVYYDLPLGFEERCFELVGYLKPKLTELENLIINNKIFIERTAKVGVMSIDTAINYGVTGPLLRASGLKHDLRRVDGYSVYPEIDFEIPVGEGKMGTVGDCWDRMWVRLQECKQSLEIITQCLDKLKKDHRRTRDFDPWEMVPKKIRPKAQDLYVRAENPKGELGFYFRADGKSDVPFRCKVRSCCFSNLSVLPEIAKGSYIADLIAIVGSLDFVLGEVDR